MTGSELLIRKAIEQVTVKKSVIKKSVIKRGVIKKSAIEKVKAIGWVASRLQP